MAGSSTLPILGASLLLAVAGGIQLGESAIDMINPIHFQGPAIHPRDRGAAIEETRLRPAEPAFASLYGWDEGNSARAGDCDGCEAVVARDLYADAYTYAEPVVVHRAVAQDWQESVPTVEGKEDGGTSGVGLYDYDYDVERKERIERYAYYPIEAEDVEEEEMADEAYAAAYE
jgi:hypothetical protein